MSRYIKPLSTAVAALLVLGGAALAFSRDKEETYTVTAYFTKAIGLFENSDVNILGVPVGKVTNIQPQGDRVKVVMELPTRYKVPADAFAQIVPISIIADRYVQLAPVYEGGEYLQDGAVLDVDRTQIPAELDDVFRQLKKLLEAIEPGEEGEPGALGELIVQLNDTLKGSEQDLKGTLINASALTGSLADANEDISALLVNFDRLFTRLATRAGSLGTLNRNFAIVMTALAESQNDLRGTLANLGDLTHEVGDLVRDNGDRLGGDLTRAARITSSVLKNRASVEESLEWLPVVGEGSKKAHHPAPVGATDVRDNLLTGRCNELDQLPPEVRDLIEETLGVNCGETPQQQQGPVAAPDEEPELNCDRGVEQVRKQLRRLTRVELPADVLSEVVRPLRKRLKLLQTRCDELAEMITDPKKVDDLVERLLDELGVDDIDDLDDLPVPGAPELPGGTGPIGVGPLGGAAAGDLPAPTEPSPSAWTSFTSWLGDFASFLRWGR